MTDQDRIVTEAEVWSLGPDVIIVQISDRLDKWAMRLIVNDSPGPWSSFSQGPYFWQGWGWAGEYFGSPEGWQDGGTIPINIPFKAVVAKPGWTEKLASLYPKA